MQQKFKLLQLIHLALISGVSIAYMVFGNLKNVMDLKIDTTSLPYAFIPLVAYYLSNFIFKIVLKGIKRDATTDEKLTIYQSASIVRWAILEASCFVILFLKPDFILLGFILLIYMYLIRPTKNTIAQTLNIKNTELNS